MNLLQLEKKVCLYVCMINIIKLNTLCFEWKRKIKKKWKKCKIYIQKRQTDFWWGGETTNGVFQFHFVSLHTIYGLNFSYIIYGIDIYVYVYV